MESSNINKKVVLIASALTALQGAVWEIMAIICIALHHSKKDITPDFAYGKLLEYMMYYRFIYVGDNYQAYDGVVTQNVFYVFMWFYFLTSFVWCGISIYQFNVIRSNKMNPKIMKIYSFVTLEACVLDLTFFMLIASDYTACASQGMAGSQAQFYCYTTTGIVMVLAIKGFTLWILNGIISFTAFMMSKNKESGHIMNSGF